MLELLSQFLDSFLKPLVHQSLSYIKDTKYLNEKMEHCRVPLDSICVIMDIMGLYTNIPHDKARIVIENICDLHHNT